MANQVTQLALITAAIAARMENTLVASKLVTWNKSDSKISPLNKFQYIENVPPRYNRRRWSGTVTDLTGGKQDTVFGNEIFSLSQGDTLDFYYGDFEQIRDFDSAKRSSRIKSIGEDEGHLVDAELLKAITMAGCNWTGTPGAAIDSVEPLIAGYVRLKEEGVADGEIFAVLPFSDMPGLAKYLMELPSTDDLSTNMVTKLNFKQLAGDDHGHAHQRRREWRDAERQLPRRCGLVHDQRQLPHADDRGGRLRRGRYGEGRRGLHDGRRRRL
jgi:hypothetical protein